MLSVSGSEVVVARAVFAGLALAARLTGRPAGLGMDRIQSGTLRAPLFLAALARFLALVLHSAHDGRLLLRG